MTSSSSAAGHSPLATPATPKAPTRSNAADELDTDPDAEVARLEAIIAAGYRRIAELRRKLAAAGTADGDRRRPHRRARPSDDAMTSPSSNVEKVERFHRLTSFAPTTGEALARLVTLVEQLEALEVKQPSAELEYQFGGIDPDTGETVDGYRVAAWGIE